MIAPPTEIARTEYVFANEAIVGLIATLSAAYLNVMDMVFAMILDLTHRLMFLNASVPVVTLARVVEHCYAQRTVDHMVVVLG